jgi:hypothetical protein
MEMIKKASKVQPTIDSVDHYHNYLPSIACATALIPIKGSME